MLGAAVSGFVDRGIHELRPRDRNCSACTIFSAETKLLGAHRIHGTREVRDDGGYVVVRAYDESFVVNVVPLLESELWVKDTIVSE
jgi:hypothetical protein